MTVARHLVPALAVLVTIGACESRTPTLPADSQPPGRGRTPGAPELPPVYATIAIRSISREPGATLILRDCIAATAAGAQFCTDDLQVSFDVAADRDMPSIALRVTFLDESRRCAVTLTQSTPLSAHVPAQMHATLVGYYLNAAESGQPTDLGCDRPPITTTRMVVDVMDYGETPQGVSVMTKEFAYGYRFAIQ